MKRSVSKKLQVSDITKGRYFETDGTKGVITPLGEKASRVNIIGTITDLLN